MSSALRRTAGVALAAALSGCDCGDTDTSDPSPGVNGAVEAREGVALLVDEVELTGEEIVELARCVAALYPEYVETHHRRLALVNVLLPRAAARATHADAHEVALRACLAARDALAAGADPASLDGAPLLTTLSGYWPELGVELWCQARGLEPGAWSGPVERVGRVSLVRLDGKSGAEDDPRGRRLTVSLVDFPYLPAGTTPSELDALAEECTLIIVDPRWRESVPERWVYRMRGER